MVVVYFGQDGKIGRKKVKSPEEFHSAFGGGSRPLPVVKIGGKKYYVDERLNELRNVKNPHDREKMEGSAEFYVRHFGVKRKLKSVS